MILFNNQRELKKALDDILERAIEEIGNQTRDELKDNLMVDWYMRPEYVDNGNYERTYQLYQSITAKLKRQKNGNTKVDIFYDLDKIEAIQTGGFFNAHMSFDLSTTYGKYSITQWLIKWIEDGVSPSDSSHYIGNQPIEGKNILSSTSEWLDNNLDKIIKKVFRSYGLTLTRLN